MSMMNEPIVELLKKLMQQSQGVQDRVDRGMQQQPQQQSQMGMNNYQGQGMQMDQGMNTNVAQSIGGMFQPSQSQQQTKPKRGVKELEPWEDRLSIFKKDRASAVDEILRAKSVYETEAKAYGKGFQNTKRAKEIANWAKQVREVSGVNQKELSANAGMTEAREYAGGEIEAQRRRMQMM